MPEPAKSILALFKFPPDDHAAAVMVFTVLLYSSVVATGVVV